jgi:Flp pilus assembly protein TadB
MNYQDIKDKYFNKQFIIFYIVIFIILYIFCSFIKFLGQLPVLIILTFLIAYYLNKMMNSNKISKINNMINNQLNMSSYNLS